MHDFESWILHRDEELLVVDKPAGVLSQGGPSAEQNLVTLARRFLGVEHVGVAHRIDRNVSGIVLIPRTAHAARKISDAIARGEVEREYAAVVKGQPEQDALDIDAALEKDEKANRVRVSRQPAAKAARTHVEVSERFGAPLGRCTSLAVWPITGRSHQIRVHLASISLPIVGDPKYGIAARGVDRPLLHARRVRMQHPASGDWIEFVASIPWRQADLRVLRPATKRT